MHYLVTGGTGFIGQALIESLSRSGHQVTVISRNPDKAAEKVAKKLTAGSQANIKVIALGAISAAQQDIAAVINLAGEPIVGKRWSEARKKVLRDSRIALTTELIDRLAEIGARPNVFISGSAIGYYGCHDSDQYLTESGAVNTGFTHSLCDDWESAAKRAESALGSRVCCLRTGIVLGHGGALDKMLPAFYFWLGGPIGSGNQWMSWIHLEDQVAAMLFLLEQDSLSGVFNLTAPEAATNDELTKTMAHILYRPAYVRVPSFVLRCALGEASELLLEGQRVYPERLLQAGFTFKYPSLEPALRSILA